MGDYRNTSSQRERAAILKNDVKTQTLHGRAVNDLLMEERGRFARNINVTAAEAAPVAFKAAPWTHDHTGDEMPLGIDINQMEPVGTQQEIEMDIHRRRLAAAGASLCDSGKRDETAIASEASSGVGRGDGGGSMKGTASSPTKLRRWP